MVVGARAGFGQDNPGGKTKVAQAGTGGSLACQNAYKKAQVAEKEGELVRAKRFLRTCAKQKCGKFLEHECTVAFARIESEMPSVVPTATDEAGKPVIDMTLKVDGYVLASKLNGHAVPINPGMHEFSFETKSGAVVARKRIMIVQGQRNRRLAVSVGKAQIQTEPDKKTEAEPSEAISAQEPEQETIGAQLQPTAKKKENAAPEPEEETVSRPDIVSTSAPAPVKKRNGWMSTGSYVLLGTSVVGFAGYGMFTYWGRKDNDKLSVCSPDCPQSDIDHINNLYTAANISLAVGATALIGAGYVMWRNHNSYSLERVAIQPTKSGALATFSGSF
jgi:hypothetical protein